jgi:hypothetical protein
VDFNKPGHKQVQSRNRGIQELFCHRWATGKSFYRPCLFKTRSNEMYFGGNYGFISFKPDEIIDNEYKAPVYITEFQVFNKTVSLNNPESPLTKQITETKVIRLQWHQSVFSFGFLP